MSVPHSYSSVNGDIRLLSESALPVTDLGLQRGYGVFDFGRVRNGKLFHLDQHLERFHRSARALHLQIPISDDEIRNIASDLIRKSNLNSPAIRLILTGGDAYDSRALEEPNLVLIGEEMQHFSPDLYSQGARIMTVEFQRELPDVKSINYLNSIRLEPWKRKRGAFDILYHSTHGVTECPRSNFFGIRGNTLITPESHVLPGITRRLVLDLAADHFPVEERSLPFPELEQLDEAFLTSTSKGIMPVTRIDDRDVGSGDVGEQTRTLMQKFQDYADSY